MRASLLAAFAVLALALTGHLPASAQAGSDAAARSIHLLRLANIPFEKYSVSPTPAQIRFIDRRFDRMIVYRPYFDSRLKWYPRAWFYQNAYALYPEAAVTRDHPEWILRDGDGHRLYIPWGCSGGTCPAYAADVLDPGFRAWWIQTAAAGLAKGYRGIFVDDLSLTRRVSDGAGTITAPMNPATGRPINDLEWAQAMVAFAEQIRRAFPAAEIVHNSVWFYDTAHDHESTLLHRQIAAADYSMMEFGVTDDGITGGTGPYSLAQLMAYIDLSHSLGRAVIIGGTPADRQGRIYAVGCYLLVMGARDLIVDDNVTPDRPEAIYELRLGAAVGPRYRWQGFWRRDFAGGSVVVNGPDAPILPLAGLSGRRWDGAALPASLAAKSAVIVLR